MEKHWFLILINLSLSKLRTYFGSLPQHLYLGSKGHLSKSANWFSLISYRYKTSHDQGINIPKNILYYLVTLYTKDIKFLPRDTPIISYLSQASSISLTLKGISTISLLESRISLSFINHISYIIINIVIKNEKEDR